MGTRLARDACRRKHLDIELRIEYVLAVKRTQSRHRSRQTFYTTVAGVLLGVLRERTGSLWGGWLIHFIFDWWAVNVPPVWGGAALPDLP